MKDDDLIELTKYAQMEGTEIGECCQYLLSLWYRRDYLIDMNRHDLEREIMAQLNNFRTFSKIITKQRTTIASYEELEWL